MSDFDAIIIGAGIGGLCSAALLADSSRCRILVVEKLPFVGGRCSSLTHKGYTVTTGAVSIEAEGSLEQTFRDIGVPLPIRHPDPQVKYRVRNRDITLPERQALPFLLEEASGTSGAAGQVLKAFREASDPESMDISVSAWLGRYTEDPGVIGVFRVLCGGIFSVSLEEAPVAELFTMVRARSFRRFGFPPGGNGEIAEALASVILKNGGHILKNTKVTRICVRDSQVDGIRWKQGDREQEATASYVISNVGARKTAELAGRVCFPSKDLSRLDRMKSSYTLTVEILSDRPFVDFPGILMLPEARRAAFVACPTLICPELAPQGKHITTVLGPPSLSEEPLNLREEFETLLQDARDALAGFEKHGGKLLMRSFRKDWPGFRARPGQSMPRETPVRNLFNVGDSVNPPGLYGVGGCAETARRVVQTIREVEKW
ncbi:phytoene desaturase family protein [Thermodesulfobacteriota bacterium]